MKWRGISEENNSLSRPELLSERMLEIKAGIAEYVRPENQAVNERAIEQLRASGIADRILAMGAKAPDFELPDQDGTLVSLAVLRERGPVALVFYRGRWCPFCITQLEALNEALGRIEAAGASLLAISPHTVRQSFFAADQHKLKFPVLSDAGNQVARKFGLAYPISDEQRHLYRSVFINLIHANGDERWELPIPATYIIASDGTILYAYANPDYMRRPEPADIVRRLKAIRGA